VFPAIGIVSAPDAAVMRERQAWVWTFLTNFGLVHFGANALVHLSHLWSVAVEEQFYLVWPVVVALLSTRSLRRLCIAIVVGAPVLRLAASMAGVTPHSINWLTPLRLDALALGGLAAIMVREDGIEATLRRARVLGIAAALVLLAIFARQGGLVNHFRAVYVVGYSALAAVGCWFVVASARRAPATAVRIVFGGAFLRMLGRYSYSLYMFHQLVMVALERAGVRLAVFPTVLGSNLPAAIAFAGIVTLASLAIALLTWHLLERPALALKDRFAPSR
jgi:peptidoglycan/LPS O-acetylase OafA/YrhL